MSYIGKNPKVDSVKLEGSATQASGTEEGQLYYNTGTGSISKGLKVFKNSQFVAIDKQLGDADTFHLLKAADISTAEFSAARNSTSTSFLNQNSVPFETTTASGVAGTFSNSSTGDALLTDESADLVFAYKSSGTSDDAQEYFGIPLTVPKAFRGGNIVLTFEYRTGFGTGTTDTVDGDFEVAVLDKSTGNGAQVTSTDSTTDIAAGSNIAVSSKTGFAVGQRVRLEAGSQGSIGSPDATVVEAFVTSISTSTDHITISEDWDTPHASGARITSGWLTDVVPGQLKAADSQTNKQGKKFSIQFKTEDDTSDIVLFFQNKNTSSTISRHLFVDNILLSANKFLQASSQLKSETYTSSVSTDFWDSTGASREWKKEKLSPKVGSPPLAQSKLISISDITGPGTVGTVTAITAKQDIQLAITLVGEVAATAYLKILGSDGNSLSEYQNASGSMFSQVNTTIGLAKDDYVFFFKESSTNAIGSCQLTAKSDVSDVIVLESQDEIFTEWESWTPTWAGYGTVAGSFHYRRNGSNLEMLIDAVPATATGDNVSFTLPSGYTIDSTKFNTTVNTPVASAGFNTFNTGNYMWMVGSKSTEQDFAKIFLGVQNGTNSAFNRQAGTGFGVGEITGFISVPLQGFNSNFNPLLSMPLQDFSSLENTFSARLTNNGSTSTITSQSGNFIASVSRTGSNGGISVTFTSGFFSEIPSVVVTCDGATGNKFASVSAISTTGCTINADEDGGSNPNQNMNLTVTRQGSDFRQAPQATAAVIKPAVALLKDVKAYNVAGGGSTTGSFNSRELNVVEGESWFVTLSGTGTKGIGGTNVEFTLDPGMYKMTAKVPFVGTNFSSARLFDVTNSQVVKYGSTEYTNISTDASGGSSIIEVVKTITASTQYKVQYRVSDGTGGNGLGIEQNTDSTAVSVYTTVEIEKLK